jgi:molybdopterin synthase sulfur carrier subunit
MDWRLFANLAEAAGTRRVTVDAGPGDTFEDAFDQLLAAHPALEAEVLDGYDTVLEEGDELALFPPVSGGCVAT